ncbi:MAG TPA: rubrerythrin family protein [Syntrophobacteraceae bacterium]|nr:rubrerythrin family protein [Syntrophobacteraceae bacterium]
MTRPCDDLLIQTLDLADRMIKIADRGDLAREDVGCGVLYGVLRDSAFKIKKLAEEERAAHRRVDQHDEGLDLRRENKMSKTEQNLLEAFAGESQANRKYLAYARQAEKEGYAQIARLFRAAAEAETVHAHAHLRTAGKIKSTVDNLKDAIAGETHEFTKMYPEMIAVAREEGNKAGERTLSYANDVEKCHAALYEKALKEMGNLEQVDYYVCSVCGYTCEKGPPERCPVCTSNAKVFYKVE